MLEIRELRLAELPILKEFAPPEWHSDVSAIFRRHFGQPYFHPIVAEWAGAIAGCANGLLNGEAGWLGNIIVLPEARGKGIGTALTQHLVEFFRAKGVKHQILIATSLGERVYRKLGFEIVSNYIFFSRQEGSTLPDAAAGVRPLKREDEEAVFALDKAVTGEIRHGCLRHYLEDAWVHAGASGQVDGYYLPALGAGLIIASNDEAGSALICHKLRLGAQTCVVPEGNKVAAEMLRSFGFVETARAPRMCLGPDVNWQPGRVYARGTGFCG